MIARHQEAYHQPLPSTVHGTANESHGDGQLAADGAPSIHDLETQLTDIPPIDKEPRGLFVDRILRPAARLDEFVEGHVEPLRSWAAERMACEAHVDPGAVIINCRCDDLVKTVTIRPRAANEPATIAADWSWESDFFDADAWFSSEISFSTPLEIIAPGALRWDYAIETVAKSEKGFDRMVQGTAVVLRWPVSAGKASVSVRVAE